jgi:hypothetical protein
MLARPDRLERQETLVKSSGMSKFLFVLLSLSLSFAIEQSPPKQRAATEKEKAALVEVIERQTAAFWAKDSDRWADTWVHAPYIRRLGWSESGGVVSIEGWDAIGAAMKKNMAENPKPNPTPAKVVRDHLNFRIYDDVAWVTFEQHGVDTGEARFDMPGLSYETRMFEKHGGKWKVVYLSYLLAGNSDRKPPR